MIKVIKIHDDTWNRLRKYGVFGDTNDGLIRRVLDKLESPIGVSKKK
jgi:hypothetical protein